MERTLYIEHIIWRTRSIENTFYTNVELHMERTLYIEHIIWRTCSIQNTFYTNVELHMVSKSKLKVAWNSEKLHVKQSKGTYEAKQRKTEGKVKEYITYKVKYKEYTKLN